MNIIQRFIPASNKETRPGIKMTPKYITIHETDNPGAGADANAHAQLQERGNDRAASWHLQIDDQEAIQSIPFTEVAYAAGDGKNGPGNTLSIHIEIAVNSDGDFQKAVSNTAEVTKQLMVQFNIPLSNVVQHNHWTGKNCPRYLRSGEKGITWSNFIAMLENYNTKKIQGKGVEEVLKPGDKGESVKVLNYQLASLGYISWADREGDVFGNSTLNALKKFQKEQRIKETGEYDAATALQFAKILAIYYDRLKQDKML
ncbi:N-acetylmuramoyl-L-alanine amidase [Neobacillus sp. MM2021_6]|uniref:peptidoglycan recognition protein family protein n=1 Tax=Bacillaceae TaxID=186817 RepID=UPI0014099004|nr:MULTISPECIES: N-acetylmuramoyl-L-alanine amidase [Bacillaceae]MBO0961652.1 N-acetylmuramoyl-L-alanine amidase [Neobacillus sp. MM2021_6]NHC21238.1 N-acetylmuramoyl-L-alanine amidase [Bacillus sp. MM2020_4]